MGIANAARRSALIGAGISALLVIATPLVASAAPPAQPHIRARPASVMVNHPVSLRGAGFQANTAVELTECSKTNWIAPQQFCSTGNSRSVRTDHRGAFVVSFVMDLCPKSTPATGPVTERTCYVGEVEPKGVDTLELVGAAKVTVTYP